jgi:hypothetical protein
MSIGEALQHIRIMLLHSQRGSPSLRSFDSRPPVVVVTVRIRYPLINRVRVPVRASSERAANSVSLERFYRLASVVSFISDSKPLELRKVVETQYRSSTSTVSFISGYIQLRNVVVLVRARSCRLPCIQIPTYQSAGSSLPITESTTC